MLYGSYAGHELDRTRDKILLHGGEAIRNCSEWVIFKKPSYDDVPDKDRVTTADRAAQTAMEAARQKHTPKTGAIGEEDGLRVMCKEGEGYWTFDGLDGTKRLVDCWTNGLEPDGISTMTAFVYNGRVVVAGIAEVFGQNGRTYRLWSDGNVTLTVGRGDSIDLKAMKRTTQLKNGKVVLRGDPNEYHPLVVKLLGSFKKEQLEPRRRHSIGLTNGELWADDAVLHVQTPGWHTPWDDTPLEIGKGLGFVYLRPSANGRFLEKFDPPLVTELEERKHCTLIVHRSRIKQLYKLV